MFVKRLSEGVYDVFVGTGWNWTRVRRTKDGVQYVAGQFLNRASLTQLKERLFRK